MAFRVPDRVRKGLSILASASQQASDELAEHLAKLPLQIPQEDTADGVANQLKSLPAVDGRAVIHSLMSLAAFKGSSNQNTEKLVSDVLADLKKADKEPAFANDLIDRLAQRLPLLLGLSPLTISSKAIGILTDNQRIFREARVLSDIRAVFSDNVEAMPAAAVIVHELKLEYYESGDRKEWFIALDSRDLQKLINVLERAKQKDSSLRLVLSAANLPFLDPR